MADVLGFSAEQVSRLTGLSHRQLRYWDDTEFFTPTFREDARHTPWARVYSFRDVVGLRAIAEMRQRFRIPLQYLRKVGAELQAHHAEPWSELTFYIVGRQVFFGDSLGAIERADRTHQQLMPCELAQVEGDVRGRIARLRSRTVDEIGKVSKNRYIAHNQPVLDGTRIPTAAIWEFHEAGLGRDGILREYPQLHPADVEAALMYESGARKKAS